MDSKGAKGGFKKLMRSFGYASEGVVSAWKSEQNFRIHTCMGMIVLVMAALLHVSKVEWMVILILIFLMHSLEMVNTAIEKAVDLSTSDYHPLAKLAKDLGSGAVLLFAICSAIIGLIIFIPKIVAIF
ncbi:diacylglycerol kinase [Rossellomorea marisflavi]|uniref:diacylglycerol kinase family protein n=1 Tax=Rossellomorea marisflavi TaxID=189381 RepID=UPI0025C8DF9B|nr:diacylglycerol kinase family protein [Rossellomorea marisflavi]UTE74333.1 diacylglycerol kinase family protein [Rossellomorea marisflavi]GLI84329.1 diacylglycerol kinase [Rossellomorea marisflavi]